MVGMEEQQDNFVAADVRLRRVAIASVVLVSAVGVVGLLLLARSLRGIENLEGDALQAAVERTILATAVIAWVAGLSLVGCGLWLFRLARRINRSGCYPPPGMKVVRNTRVRTGSGARMLATAALFGSLVCVAAGSLGVWRLYVEAVDVFRALGGAP